MKLSFSTLGCPDWTLETIANKAVEYGFDGIELRAYGNKHVDPSMCIEERKKVSELFKENKIEISCISGYSQFCSGKEAELEANKDLLNSYIELAKDLSAPFVRTFIGNYDGLSEDQVAANAAHYLNICGEKALECGVTVLAETHDSFSTARQVSKIMSQIKNKGTAVLWDIHHSIRNGETPWETFNILGKLIKHVHMKDAEGDSIRLMGKGTLPVREIIALLRQQGYNGYLSLEWEKMWIKELEEPEIAFPQYISYMRELL